jgi:hypothetical protein
VIRERLQKRNIKSFLDVDDLKSHYFDERLYREIENSPNFIIILTPGCLDRCVNEEDWLRKEILHAIETQRNIIPILKDGFSFSCLSGLKGIPPEFSQLPRHHAITYSHEYFDSVAEKLEKFLEKSNPSKQEEVKSLKIGMLDSLKGKAGNSNRWFFILFGAGAAVIAVIIYILFESFPKVEVPLKTETSAYLSEKKILTPGKPTMIEERVQPVGRDNALRILSHVKIGIYFYKDTPELSKMGHDIRNKLIQYGLKEGNIQLYGKDYSGFKELVSPKGYEIRYEPGYEDIEANLIQNILKEVFPSENFVKQPVGTGTTPNFISIFLGPSQ